ncbi:MAG: Na/Pi symporter [Candidatus Omnitrophica bacterium]|nr:Na/Pi symporter [Candidatus Omnitrophota bacterium]
MELTKPGACEYAVSKSPQKPAESKFSALFRFLFWILLLYLFLLSIGLMGAGFKALGNGFAAKVLNTTAHPIVALMIGVIATSLVQSSSTTTSIIVGMVAGGSLPIRNAVPILMGANVGTTITNMLVAMGHVTRKEEFRRAYAGATVHDFFNLLAVGILLPIELYTHILERSAIFLSASLEGMEGLKFTSPVKTIIKPAIDGIKHLLTDTIHLSHTAMGWTLVAMSFVLLVLSLTGLVQVMRRLVASRSEEVFHRVLCRSGIQAMIVGMLFTAFVQSSSITTSVLVPMVGAGILTVTQVYPVTLGANVGTTVTALLASMTGNSTAVAVALVHLLFNVYAILIFYPIRFMRRIPIWLAETLAGIVTRRWWFAIIYILCVFFVIPGIVIYLTK